MPTVEIEKPADEPLGAWFEALRDWLDRNGCLSVTFARVGQGGDRVVYRLAFPSGAQARKFSQTFEAYLTGASAVAADDRREFVALDTLGDAAA